MLLIEELSFRPSPRRDHQQVATARSFEQWVGERCLVSLSTNAGAEPLPFQQWKRFKEAYSPELVNMAVKNSTRKVRRLCDPFGGSGTSALAAQFMGIDSVNIEVNPFLAELIAAKVERYDVGELLSALPRVARRASKQQQRPPALLNLLPPTFIEPGRNGRWLFDIAVATEIANLRISIEQEEDTAVRRLFTVLLGGMLVDLSNAVISGKGRRYRRGWETRRANPTEVLSAFCDKVGNAIVEIDAHCDRPLARADVLQGDCRARIHEVGMVDLVVCSPPYPNSFDYTDVYNIELWMLGYLCSSQANGELRRSTLSSHVQVSREFSPAPRTPILDNVMQSLLAARAQLWDVNLVAMVGGYFADLRKLLEGCAGVLRPQGQAWFVVGDSQYAGVTIPVAQILAELGPAAGFKAIEQQPFRSMRLSPQQGGEHKLAETLVILTRM